MNVFVIFSKNRWIRRLGYFLLFIVLLLAVVYLWFQCSGTAQLKRVEATFAANGETLDFVALLPETPKNEENFCGVHSLKELGSRFYPDTSLKIGILDILRVPRMPSKQSGPPLAFSNLSGGVSIDLNSWVQRLRTQTPLVFPVDSGSDAHDLKMALTIYEPLLRELASGLDRRYARWVADWRRSMVPPYQMPMTEDVGHFTILLTLHAIADAIEGGSARAHESALILARIMEACTQQPLTGFSVWTGGAKGVCCVTWEICNVHSGSVHDFVRLENAIRKLDSRQMFLDLIRVDIAIDVRRMNEYKYDRSKGVGVREDLFKGVSVDFAVRFLPDGFFDGCIAQHALDRFENYIEPLKRRGWLGAVDRIRDWEAKAAKKRSIVNSVAGLDLLPSSMSSIISGLTDEMSLQTFAFLCDELMPVQARLDQAAISCALERYRSENGNYPESLGMVRLAHGGSLPLDVFTGKPYKYRLEGENGYRIWSVGYNEMDDGGMKDDSVWLLQENK